MLLLLAACDRATPPAAPAPPAPDIAGAPLDELPGRRTLAPSGTIEAIVAPGGILSIRKAGKTVEIDEGVDARLAFSPDEATVVYARQGEWAETDLWAVETASGRPTELVAWPGSEDRPVFSPDGRRLAFVSGRTGIASWWVVDLATVPVPPEAGRQVTNVGVEHAAHAMGEAPAGFVPVPDGQEYAWTDAGLTWVADGERHTVAVP